jgi:hypothetical protein
MISNRNPLLGTWKLISEEVYQCSDGVENYQEKIPCSDSVCFRITFEHAGKMKVEVTMAGKSNSWDQTYSVKDHNISICDQNGCNDEGTFIINGTDLTLANSLKQGCQKKEFYKKIGVD